MFPLKFRTEDRDKITEEKKVIFKNNMTPIMKCFEEISLRTLRDLTNI
jgi:hypothetical protein